MCLSIFASFDLFVVYFQSSMTFCSACHRPTVAVDDDGEESIKIVNFYMIPSFSINPTKEAPTLVGHSFCSLIFLPVDKEIQRDALTYGKKRSRPGRPAMSDQIHQCQLAWPIDDRGQHQKSFSDQQTRRPTSV